MRNSIILWGVGKQDTLIRDYFVHNYNMSIKYIVDSDTNIQGTKVCEIAVVTPDKLKMETEEVELVITSLNKNTINSICQQIKDMKLSDNIHIITGKDRDYWKMLCSEYVRKRTELLPLNLVIELSSYCNLQCELCFFHGYLNGNKGKNALMTWEIVKEIAKQAKRWKSIERLYCFHSGEELLNPEWFEMLSFLLEEIKVKEIIFSTNGMLLNDENIEKFGRLQCENITLQISLSGENQKECEYWRKNLDYELVKNNIIKAQKRLPSNVHMRLNVDYMIDYETIKNSNFIIDIEKYVVPKYIQNDFKNIECSVGPTVLYENVNMMQHENIDVVSCRSDVNACLNMFNLMCIDSQGFVLNCCCNGGQIRLGNILETDALDIWKNHNIMIMARNQILDGKIPSICSSCSYAGHNSFYIPVKRSL